MIDIIFSSFFLNLLFAAILCSVAAGITGTFIHIKRLSYISSGIAHGAIGGVGFAIFFSFSPVLGALIFAILSALIFSWIKFKLKENEDIIISIIWSLGMALGIILSYLTPGYNTDILSYLFGNILLVSQNDLLFLLLIDITVIISFYTFYWHFVYLSFDEEYTYLRGINIYFYYTFLLVLIALTIIILVQAVGLILVIALLSIPTSNARLFSHNLKKIIILSIIFCFFIILIGFIVSLYLNTPTGATIIVISCIVYLISYLFKRKK